MSASDKQCPICKLWNPGSARRCDCGHKFTAEKAQSAIETDPPVVVATITGRPVAELLKCTLEEEGVPCELSQSGLGSTYGGVIGPFAHVDVLVPAQFEQAARKIVDNFNQSNEIKS